MSRAGIQEHLRRAAEGQSLAAHERAALAQWLLADPTQTDLFGVTVAGVDRAVAERLSALPAASAALSGGPLCVAGYEEQIEVPPESLFRFHLPLAQFLTARARQTPGRFLVGVAGVPASGKSVFAALMARVLAVLRPPVGVAVIGLDGYHYANAHLRSHPAPAAEPEPGPLQLYKGAHFTFDVRRLVADLRRIRQARDPVALPAYDRTIHDPVDGRILVRPDERLILLEGNFLLYRSDGWQAVGDLLDLSVFLDLPPGANRQPLLARHRRGGRTHADALRHYRRVDVPNTHLALSTRRHADLVVELDADHAVRSVLPR